LGIEPAGSVGEQDSNRWHQGDLVIEEGKIRAELCKAQQAYFTDTEDSAAWIYSQWLLSGAKSSRLFRLAFLQSFVAEASILIASPAGGTLYMSTNRATNVPVGVEVIVNEVITATILEATSATRAHTDYVWTLKLDVDLPNEMCVSMYFGKLRSSHLSLRLSASSTLSSSLTRLSPTDATFFVNLPAIRRHLQPPKLVAKEDIEQQIALVDELIEAEADLTVGCWRWGRISL